MYEVQQLHDYLASNPNAIIQYHASGMILFIHSGASYLSATKARSRASVQFAEPEDNTPLLPKKRLKFIQQVVGVFLYYSIAIDNTVLFALSDIGSEQARATSKTIDEVQQILD